MADDVANWIGEALGLPYSHSHYMRLYRNGTLHYPVSYDIEVPDRAMARDWFGGGGLEDTLYKMSGWFEYNDSNDNGPGSLVWAGFQKKPATAPPFKLAAYRFNWLIHPGSGSANNYASLYELLRAANASDKLTTLMNLADMEQWMRTFAFRRVLGDWDSWSYNTGQNMYLYTPLGQRATLFSWDMDFVLGLGEGATASLFSAGQDSVVAALFNVPAYRRMLWRGYQDAVNGPLQKTVSDAQFDARRSVLLKNKVTNASAPNALKNYVAARRNFLQTELRNADAAGFSVTTRDLTNATSTATITGVAPFGVATIEINDVPYPVTWTSAQAWTVKVPLAPGANVLRVAGKDLRGNLYPGATAAVTVTYPGSVPWPEEAVVINEIMYHPPRQDAEFVELHNTHASHAFELSGHRLAGVDFTFGPGTFLPPNGYLVVVKDAAVFAATYGATIPIAGEYAGTLRHEGETLRLVRPGETGEPHTVVDQVRYEPAPPWPSEANGLGPSLQLLDPTQDNWRAGNWAVTPTNDVNRATPGRANANRAVLEAFPHVWINEVLVRNETGRTDSHGERDPWIELHNAGPETVDLGSCYLSTDPLDPTQWPFPAGATLPPGGFAVVWADGQPEQSLPAEWHTRFRLDRAGGYVGLSRRQGDSATLLDYVRYPATEADQSFGLIVEGAPERPHLLSVPTPGGPNNPAGMKVPVSVNEWMSGNVGFLADPATGEPADWFELYNAGAETVALAGYYLSDDFDDLTKFRIPPGFALAPHGFLLVWADQRPEANSPSPGDLHVNFRLAKAGDTIILTTPNGWILDAVAYDAQADNVSSGRYPDGGGDISSFAIPTPGAPNVASPLEPPQFREIARSGAQLTVTWATTPGRTYRLEYKDAVREIAWISLGEDRPATSDRLSATVSLNDSVHRFFRVVQVR